MKPRKRCVVCGVLLPKNKHKYCVDCVKAAYNKKHREARARYRDKHRKVKVCKWCGEKFTASTQHHNYCSYECAENAKEERSRTHARARERIKSLLWKQLPKETKLKMMQDYMLNGLGIKKKTVVVHSVKEFTDVVNTVGNDVIIFEEF